MQERAGKLSGITGEQNPDYESSLTWEPMVGIERARAYYHWRYEHDVPEGTGVEERADAAARHAFYGYACKVFDRATFREEGVVVESSVSLLPKNTDEVRGTDLYTEPMWPTSNEEDGPTLHFSRSCPGARGGDGPLISLAALEMGAARECDVCRFGVGDVGKAPAASTSIDNGFEYHVREFTLALGEYAEARQYELEMAAQAKEDAEQAGDSFESAISTLAGKRPRIAPPGRYGCIGVVAASESELPDELSTSFADGGFVPARGAVSAAVLAPHDGTTSKNVLSGFFDTLEARVGDRGPVGLIGSVMDVWGRLLVSYGDAASGIEAVFSDISREAGRLGVGPVGEWLTSRLQEIVRAMGIEPVDLRQRKPVLTDSARVIDRAGWGRLADVQSVMRSLPIGSSDPAEIARALEYELGEYVQSLEITLMEVPLPGGGTVPFVIRVRELFDLEGAG